MQNLTKKLDNMSKARSKKSGGGFMKILVVLVILAIAIGLPLFGAYKGAKQVSTSGKAFLASYKSENLDEMSKNLKETQGGLEMMDTSLNFLIWMRIIPFIGGYYSDAKGFTSAGVEESKALSIILESLAPYKVELGFTGQPQVGTNRIVQGLKILEKSLPNLDKIQPNLKKASDSVKSIDTGKYPQVVRGVRLRDLLNSGKQFIIGADIAVRENRSALEVAPGALGATSPKNYLLLFQNDKEIRGTGGFLTAFATVKIDKGNLSTTGSDDIYRLDEKLQEVCQNKICPLTPPAPIAKYLPEADGKPRKSWSLRDSNLSPDLPTSADQFEKMFSILGQGLPFDGIIYIDTQVVEELIAVTGPIDVYGTNYSATLDKRCNCPNVIYELEGYAEIASKGQSDRKAILGTLMQQILGKLIGADVSKVPTFMTTVVKLANDKHIMFYMHEDNTQEALSTLNWTGQIKNFEGDYLHINDSNFAGGKSNLYVNQTVTQEISIKNGKVQKHITVEYKNPQKFDTWLNGINRDYVRFYVPKGSELVTSKGSDVPVTTIKEDLGKTVFEAFITVRPQNSRKLEITYTIPYQPSGKYDLLVQKQPGAKDFHYIIKVNGSQKADFDLTTDKQFNFGI